ncbi:hypothetical protein RJ641_027379 [Dillenia turbinata]|uniref:Protein NDH-DEPENDENT CYCLIC ELECTRON FLOW 5 n=1 Tax=Dillenia turbinata TaxID=194707 RepID=A0AAN8ZLK4_9MAGN
MACSFFSIPSLSFRRPAKNFLYFQSYSFNPSPRLQFDSRSRDFRIAAAAEASVFPYPQINVDYLEKEFSGHGVNFSGIGNSCVVKMELENGSVATLILPSGLITSYKARMWHGGTVETLHTLVSEGEDGASIIQGGVSLAFKCTTADEVPWFPTSWALHSVRGCPKNHIEIELINADSQDMIQIKYIVTLQPDLLSSKLVIENLQTSSSLRLIGSVMSHLRVSTPDATYAVGLEGSDFFTQPPLPAEFVIIPPDFEERRSPGSRKSWAQTMVNSLFSGWVSKNGIAAGGTESSKKGSGEMVGEETDNYKQLSHRLSRIYTSAPRSFTVLDRVSTSSEPLPTPHTFTHKETKSGKSMPVRLQMKSGRRNSIVVGREGFDELYMFSPGAEYEFYGKYSYVCIGQSAMLEPIVVGPREVWKGGLRLHNPNL